MADTPDPQSRFSEGLLAKASGGVSTIHSTDLQDDWFPSGRQSFAKRVSLALASFLITFGIGLGATLVWQSYGDTAREMIANASPQLAWLAPAAAPAPQDPTDAAAPAEPVAPTAPVASASDQQLLGAVSLNIDAVRQSIDRIAMNQEQMSRTIGQLVAGQEQMTQEIAKLRSIGQNILYKNSEPAPAAPAATSRSSRPRATPAPPPR